MDIRIENALMETAMRIQEVFDDMSYSCHVNPDKVDNYEPLERLQLFAEWAREFEQLYIDDPGYTDNFIELTEQFATTKINNEFGIDF